MQAAPLRALIALVLTLLTLVGSGCQAQPASRATPALVQAPRLQEVAPPGAVAALSERLAEHQPRVEIVAPADDTLLPDGPWTLQLRVSDWPLGEAEGLGLGPHVVVQLDQQPPMRLSSPEAAEAVSMPSLQPGSHRLTVYAARPWGEAVKSAGAVRQIRLHRVSRNRAELPPQGSAQLIVASPSDPAQQEPVLLDWLLLDAPLQNLQNNDARWRLRVSVNGDSVLVDRQTPLWLKGFRSGSNAVQLELLDTRGEALNPPFNSVVREVMISREDQPAWRSTNLSPGQLALLSGEPPRPNQVAEPQPRPAPEAPLTAIPAPEPEIQAEPEPQAEAQQETPFLSDAVPQPGTNSSAEPTTEPVAELPAQGSEPTVADDSDTISALAPDDEGIVSEPDEAGEARAAASPAAEPLPIAAEPASQDSDATTIEPAATKPVTPSARELVNADGSLMRPKPRGPLAGLREKLGG